MSDAPDKMTIVLRTVSGMNAREHFGARATRVRRERRATSNAIDFFYAGRERPALPCSVTLTRVAPSNGLDDDNLVSSLKGVRDEIAAWFGVDDRESTTLRFQYAQKRGQAFLVLVEFGPPVSGAQLRLQVDHGVRWPFPEGHA